MKFKVKNTEMIALIMLFADAIKRNRELVIKDFANDDHAKASMFLFISMFEEMHIKLQEKALIKKDAYSIKWSPAQALAFWVEFNDSIKETLQIGNIIQTMCNAIHQQIICK